MERSILGKKPVLALLLLGICAFDMADADAQKVLILNASALTISSPPSAKLLIPQKDRLNPATIIRTGYLNVDSAFFPRSEKPSANAGIELKLFNDTKVSMENLVVNKMKTGVLVWEGTIPARVYGHASLAFINNSISGILQVDNKVYEISPTLQSGVAEIVELDQSNFPDPTKHGDEAAKQTLQQPKRLTTSLNRPLLPAGLRRQPILSVINILAIYPVPNIAPVVRPAICNPYILALNAAKLEASLNNAMPASFSEIATHYNNPRMHVRFEVTARCQTGINLDRSLYQQRQDLRNSIAIQALRNTYHADLVALISPKHTGIGCGSSDDAPGLGLIESQAFTVVDQGCALPVFSFAHEIGHLLGMHHERYTAYTQDNSEFPETCSYGYTNVLDGYTTILGGWKLCADLRFGQSNVCPKVGIFSRGFSDLKDGVACSSEAKNGMLGRADNLGQLLIAAPVVSRYR